MRRLVAAVALAAVVVLGGACEVDVRTSVRVEQAGDGVVRVDVVLDEEAAARVPDLAEGGLAVADLEAAGWVVSTPLAVDGGGVRITAVRPFSSPEEAERVLAQLTGEGGVLQGIALDVDRSFARTTSRFAATVDLTGGLAAFADPRLVEQLGGQPFGVPLDELERRFGTTAAEAFRFAFVVDLPGEEPVTWTPALGERVELAADGRRSNTTNLALAAVAVVAGLALAVVLLAELRRRRPGWFSWG